MWERDKYLILLSIPGIIITILFKYLPMYGVIIAFKDYNAGLGIMKSPWAGFYHFETFFMDIYAWRIFRNTLLLGFYSLLFGFPAPIILALILNEVKTKWFKRTIQTITYLPYFVSVVIVVGLMKDLMSPVDGIINSIIQSFGVKPINFFAEEGLFRTIYIGSGIWQGVGFGTIIYLAALAGVNPELYKAAIVNEANRWQRLKAVTIPSILPTLSILLILNVGGILGNDFQKILLMYSPVTYETADVISTYVYRAGIENANYSFASAVGLMISVVSLIFVISANYISKKLSETSLW